MMKHIFFVELQLLNAGFLAWYYNSLQFQSEVDSKSVVPHFESHNSLPSLSFILFLNVLMCVYESSWGNAADWCCKYCLQEEEEE